MSGRAGWRRVQQSGALRHRGMGPNITHLIPAPIAAPAEYIPGNREPHSLRCAPAPTPLEVAHENGDLQPGRLHGTMGASAGRQGGRPQ